MDYFYTKKKVSRIEADSLFVLLFIPLKMPSTRGVFDDFSRTFTHKLTWHDITPS